jgi:GT2 family glycosyltransferase
VSLADSLLTSKDVEDCCRLFLGRGSGPDAARCVNRPLRAVLGEILQTPEFQSGVLGPLLLREALPHEAWAPAPPPRLADWAQRRLPLSPPARAAAGGARSWTLLLEGLLAEPVVIALAPALQTAGIDRVLGERLARPPGKIERAVIGAIDSASALEIRGWALDLCDKSQRVALEFYADHFFLGMATCGESRPDVQESMGGDGRCGFTFRVPAARREALAGGRALVAVDALSRQRVGISTPVAADVTAGLDVLAATRAELKSLREILERLEARLPDLTRLASVPLEAYGDYWARVGAPSADGLARERARAAAFAVRPLISVILPTWQSDPRLLGAAIDSVVAQTYDHWELIVSDDASPADDTRRRLLERYAADPRIRLLAHAERAGIAANTNRGIAVAAGEYVAFLDHDDALAPGALFAMVEALQERPFGLLYSDEDRIEENAVGQLIHHTPFFKPGFDPELLCAMNYLCHLVMVRRDVLGAVGGLRSGFDGAQDHELLLRIVEAVDATQVRHVPKILYHWRRTPGSVSGAAGQGPVIQAHGVSAVQAHLDRRGTGARAAAHADPYGAARPFATRVRWPLPARAPPVSVVIATRDRRDLLEPCVESLRRTAPQYPGALEILIVDHDSVEPGLAEYLQALTAAGAARTLRFRGPFNWSAMNNAAAREATGEILVFLNNDTVALSPDWCAELVANAVRPEVGAVGARLLYEDGTIQHAGVVLGVEGVAGHDSVGEAPERGGYFGRSHLQRSASAVTGACLATRRELFQRLGGFDEISLAVAFNDVDYCLRLRDAGFRVLYDPFAVLYHYESRSRGYDLTEAQQARHRAEGAVLRARWGALLDADPYYNPHFERHARPFERLRVPP